MIQTTPDAYLHTKTTMSAVDQPGAGKSSTIAAATSKLPLLMMQKLSCYRGSMNGGLTCYN
jgi:hypothetical protein